MPQAVALPWYPGLFRELVELDCQIGEGENPARLLPVGQQPAAQVVRQRDHPPCLCLSNLGRNLDVLFFDMYTGPIQPLEFFAAKASERTNRDRRHDFWLGGA